MTEDALLLRDHSVRVIENSLSGRRVGDLATELGLAGHQAHGIRAW